MPTLIKPHLQENLRRELTDDPEGLGLPAMIAARDWRAAAAAATSVHPRGGAPRTSGHVSAGNTARAQVHPIRPDRTRRSPWPF